MDTHDQDLILSLVSKKISDDEFLRQYPVNPRTDESHIRLLLESALEKQEKDVVEFALILGFRFGFSKSCVPTLNKLLIESWHIKHEDITLALQKMKDPSSVDALYQAALSHHAYLDYDDSQALAVKCIRALGDIGTDEARQKLELLAKHENTTIRERAAKVLNRPE
jgi:hypothetical protein